MITRRIALVIALLAAGTRAAGADAVVDGIAIGVRAPDGALTAAEVKRVEATFRSVVVASSSRLRSLQVASIEIEIAPTLGVAEARCSIPPTIALDPTFVRRMVAVPNPEYATGAIAYVLAHELGHLPDCDDAPDAELRADEFARDVLTRVLGRGSKYFVRHPLQIDFDAEHDRLLALLDTVDSPEALADWADDLVRTQELMVRDGRVFSTFMSINLWHAVRWAGAWPYSFAADTLHAAIDARPELLTQRVLDAAQRSLELDKAVLDWMEQFDERRFLSNYDLWSGGKVGRYVFAAGFERAGDPVAALGWRVSAEAQAPGFPVPWLNAGLRFSFRELRLADGGAVAARTFGIEAAFDLPRPISTWSALGLAASLGWEWDLQQRGPWSRGRHHAVAGADVTFDARIGRVNHAKLAVGIRAPLLPDPGRGWSLLASASVAVCLIKCGP